MLSKSSKYAIRGVLYLALYSNEEEKFSPKQIADNIQIPAAFLAKTLQILAKNKLISSTKGRHGGFYLTDKNKSNYLISIIDCIDGLSRFETCILGLPVCSTEQPCPVHHKVAPFRKKLFEILSCKTINDFTLEIKQGKTHLFL